MKPQPGRRRMCSTTSWACEHGQHRSRGHRGQAQLRGQDRSQSRGRCSRRSIRLCGHVWRASSSRRKTSRRTSGSSRRKPKDRGVDPKVLGILVKRQLEDAEKKAKRVALEEKVDEYAAFLSHAELT